MERQGETTVATSCAGGSSARGPSRAPSPAGSRIRDGTLVAIGARDPGRAGYAEAFPGARVVAGYEALLADPEVEAVYIATPHPSHAEWAIKAAEAGKHALVEKPLGLTAYEADAIFHAARRAGTFIGEAFMYRLHPQTARLLELIRERRDRRGADDQVELRLRDAAVRSRRTGSMPTNSPAAASSTSAATRCRWRG